MKNTLSLAEAKAHLSECVRSAEEGQSVVITRHGKPVAALVRFEELAELERLRKAGPQAGLAGVLGGWDGSEELVEQILNSPRQAGREIPELD
jgi:prevent-host-death family protein